MGDLRDAKEEVRARLNILDVVSEYVAVKRAGKSFKGLCPFHSEKTPSFTVSEEYQSWHCFGCGENGDLFTFIMRMENLTFPEALERLAQRAGVALESYQDHQVNRRDLLTKINSTAAAYYSALLNRMPIGLEYLRARGLADQTIEMFRLGYAAPAWDGLYKFLVKKGINPDDAVEAGLLTKSDRGYFDRFRHRIIYPILDIQERIIAFGGRALGDDPAKYLNSPETPIFSKTKSLYGLNLARKTISSQGCAVVVEGYMDVITAHQAGFTHCVASLGTALTPEHIKILSRYTQSVVLAYDADSAGMKATLRGMSMFDEAECDVRMARLPGGDDPDSLIRNGNSAAFHKAITEALRPTDFKIALLQERHDLSTMVGRAAMLKDAIKVLSDVPELVERERHIRALARYHPNYETGTTRAEDHLRMDVETLVRRKQGEAHDKPRPRSTPKPPAGLQVAENSVLKVLISGGEGLDTIIESLTPEDFSGELARAAAHLAFGMFHEKRGIYVPELLGNADKKLSRFISELLMREDGPPISAELIQDYIAAIKKWKIKNMRTQDILAPYIRQGAIDASDGSHEERVRQLEAFLKKTGKLPGSPDSRGV